MSAVATVSASLATSSSRTVSSLGPSSSGSNRTLVIVLSTVLSFVGFLFIAGCLLICCRKRSLPFPIFARGISPIDDDEIATWKKVPGDEKRALPVPDNTAPTPGASSHPGPSAETEDNPQANLMSAVSVRNPPHGVIVYNSPREQGVRRSSETSPRSVTHDGYGCYGRTSTDHELPQTTIQARAPNARAGLTDEAIPGDDPFLPSPKRQPSRISKPAPNSTSPRAGPSHARTRSSRSSMRSFAEYGWAGSEMELSPRGSREHINSRRHSRMYSSSSVPPRMSFGDDGVVGGPSSKPLCRDDEIGRAIG